MPAAPEPPHERYDRQTRLPGWNQEMLARARVGVAGDDPWLTGLTVASAAALGINRLSVVAPAVDPRLIIAARGLNPDLDLALFPGLLSHPLLLDLLTGCDVLIDLGHYGLTTKLLLGLAQGQGLPLVRGYAFEEDGGAGVRLFTYMRGREWRELLAVLPRDQIPTQHRGDPVRAMIVAGLVLEETKKLLLGEEVTPEVVSYSRPALTPPGGLGEGCEENAGGGATPPLRPWPFPHISPSYPIAVVGAGALGNFVGLGLAALGCTRLTFLDPDRVEVTNLNRQILFWDRVGEPKAAVLAERIAGWFGAGPKAKTAYVTRKSDLSRYAAVFDCTDNFESRIVLSEKCKDRGLMLISGGTDATAGQAVFYDPARGGPTPAELLGLYDLVGRRDVDVQQRALASCVYAPEPAVIMTNQIVAGLMVDGFRRLLAGEAPVNRFYDARAARMLE